MSSNNSRRGWCWWRIGMLLLLAALLSLLLLLQVRSSSFSWTTQTTANHSANKHTTTTTTTTISDFDIFEPATLEAAIQQQQRLLPSLSVSSSKAGGVGGGNCFFGFWRPSCQQDHQNQCEITVENWRFYWPNLQNVVVLAFTFSFPMQDFVAVKGLLYGSSTLVVGDVFVNTCSYNHYIVVFQPAETGISNIELILEYSSMSEALLDTTSMPNSTNYSGETILNVQYKVKKGPIAEERVGGYWEIRHAISNRLEKLCSQPSINYHGDISLIPSDFQKCSPLQKEYLSEFPPNVFVKFRKQLATFAWISRSRPPSSVTVKDMIELLSLDRVKLYLIGDSTTRGLHELLMHSIDYASKSCNVKFDDSKISIEYIGSRGLYNDLESLATHLSTLESELLPTQKNFLFINLGLWDAAYGSMKNFYEKVDLVLERLNSLKFAHVYWRLSSTIHPGRTNQLLPKHRALNPIRIQAINSIVHEKLNKYPKIKLLEETYAASEGRADGTVPEDIRHYCENVVAENLQEILYRIKLDIL